MKVEKHTIYKYCHRPFPFKIVGVKKANTLTIRRFKFLDSCCYFLDNGDQYDWNKLYGVTFGLFGIHENSVRFAWRYDTLRKNIVIAAYWYINGERNYYTLCSINFNEKYDFKISIVDDYVKFTVLEDNFVKIGEFELYMGKEILSKSKYQCGIYFGGNRRAPHKIEIKEYSE